MLHFSVRVTDLGAASGGGGANKVVTCGMLTARLSHILSALEEKLPNVLPPLGFGLQSDSIAKTDS